MAVETDLHADGWTLSSKTGLWSRSFGDWGTKVRVFQKRPGGSFYRAIYLTHSRKDVACLHSSDRTQAIAIVAPQLRTLAEAACAPRVVTLGQLCERYLAECELLRDNGPAHRADTDTRIAILLAYFGAERNVQTLSKEVQRRYERVRIAGGIQYTRQCRVWQSGRRVVGTVTRVTPPTRARSAEADLVLLHTMLNWATTAPRRGWKPLAGRQSAQGRGEASREESASAGDITRALHPHPARHSGPCRTRSRRLE